ncbi:hypothetical protein [Acinetobacter sp. YH16038]|uniref:hypothetical protein n=1 Tax=Acinetobacter sp. YH16038 TaxID=2601183 RepID=UPI0015D1F64F|nr:hypothetical protein [Acinetobacter sp. YH16038]
MNKNPVTEQDIRLPQFRDAKLEDLEFDASGEVVRKDRFETSMRKISSMLHGVNGLSARCSWTCEQVVDAVDEVKSKLEHLKSLVLAIESVPEGAEFYHIENREYVKNIAKDALAIAENEPELSHLIDFDISKHGGEWEESSAWLEYIKVLVKVSDLEAEIDSIVRGAND